MHYMDTRWQQKPQNTADVFLRIVLGANSSYL